MRTLREIEADARDIPAFSNGTEGYAWMGTWCSRCIHDKSARDDSVKPDPRNDGLIGCPILGVTMLSKTPLELMRQDGFRLGDQYHCIEFRDEDDGPGLEPQPVPDPPGMDALIPREDYTAPLMFTANVPQEVRA